MWPHARALMLAAVATGCGTRPAAAPTPPTSTPAREATASDVDSTPAVTPDAGPAPAPGRFIAAVTSTEALAVVAAAGGELEDLLPAASRRAIAAAVESDVAGLKRGDRQAGVGIRRYSHRLFDVAWLSTGHWELVAVVSRLDRARPDAGDCGDTRLIYRLAYTADQAGVRVTSRLPATLAVAIAPAGGDGATDCAAVAQRWRAPADAQGASLGQWLVASGGPLGDGALVSARVQRALTNVQLVRWPSSVQPDLGGHAEYFLRELVPDASGTLAVSPLAAVPDVARIRRNRGLRAQLLAWVRDPETLAAADRGAISLPESLRARLSVAVTPRGFSRRANRAYRSLIDPKQLADLDLTGRERASSAEALLRRLDELTCAGCHQARTIAGFHVMGEDGDDVAMGNALAIPVSPHLLGELSRRVSIAEAIAAGTTPDLAPPMAERAVSDPGGAGAPCGLGDPGFAAWTCAKGLTCIEYDAPSDDRAVGRCVAEQASAIGDPCDTGAVAPRADPRRDRVAEKRSRPCQAGAHCVASHQGFPGGICAADSCGALPEGARCAIIAGSGFDRCLVQGEPFPSCIERTAARIGVASCSENAPCRDDYVCARAPDGGAACIPPYFLFQLRVDGHPRSISR